jgi:hypothetical protein
LGPVVTPNLHDLDLSRTDLGMTTRDVWLGYLGVGGDAPLFEVESWLEGTSVVPPYDFDLLVQSVNDRAVDCGQPHPGRYFDGS